MRKVLSVITSCIPPATMCVNRSSLRSFELQMPIGLVVLPRAALVFEVVDDVRHRVPLQQIALDQKRKRLYACCSSTALQVILAFRRERIKIQRPEIPVLPLLDRP